MKALTYMYIELILYEQARSHLHRASARGCAERVMGSRFGPSLPNNFYQYQSPCTLRLALIFCILVFSIEHFAHGGGQNVGGFMAWHLKNNILLLFGRQQFIVSMTMMLWENSFLTNFRVFMTIIYQIDSLRPFDL